MINNHTARIYNELNRQPRRHKCEMCQRIYECRKCTDAMETAILRQQDFHGRQDIALYSSQCQPSNRRTEKPLFICEDHLKQRNPIRAIQ